MNAQGQLQKGPSLSEMAAGGWNHAEKWMNPQATSNFAGQAPLASEPDLPPGAPPYAGGPLANPRPSPTPGTTSAEVDLPPGAPPYPGGPLANPRPSPTPGTTSLQSIASTGIPSLFPSNQYQVPPPDLGKFSWSSAFQS